MQLPHAIPDTKLYMYSVRRIYNPYPISIQISASTGLCPNLIKQDPKKTGNYFVSSCIIVSITA